MIRRTLVLVALALSVACHAQDFAWRDRDGKPILDSDRQKAKYGFGALVLLTDDEKTFENWQKPEEPKIRTITTAQRGEPVHVIVIFAGAGRDAKGDAHVTYDATVLKPDGSVYGDFKDIEALKGRPAPSSTPLQMSPAALGIVIEPQDPAGVYGVEIVIRDNVRNVELKLKEKFTVEK